MAIQECLQNLEYMDAYLPPEKYLATMYDLPSEDPKEPGVADLFHIWQSDLLSKTFCPPDYDPGQMMIATDLNLYYDPNNHLWHKRPDWFAVLGVPFLYDDLDIRLSYVVWQEKVIPNIVVELLSPGTENEDLGRIPSKPGQPPNKWEVYEQILGIPWYAVFSRYTDKLRIFQLAQLPDGRRKYCEIALSGKRIWLPDLKMGLGLWHGQYYGVERCWVRWYDKQGNWIPVPEERALDVELRAEHEKQRALDAELRAEQERQRTLDAELRLNKLEAKLKKMGMSLDDFEDKKD